MRWANNYKYVIFPKFRGGLIIESDDGYTTDYDTWYPTTKYYRQKNYWIGMNNNRVVPVNVAIVSNQVGNEGRMTLDQLKELERFGWEIMHHGRTHTRLSPHLLQSAANVGDTRLYVDVPDRIRAIYDYIISDGTKSEIVTVKEYVEGTSYIDIETPLTNSYASGTLQLTDESLRTELNLGLDELRNMGLNVKNHVVPYHMFNEKSQAILAEKHNSSRAVTNQINDKQTDRYYLGAYLLGGLTQASISSLLDEAYSGNKLLIVYGHGERSNDQISKIDFLTRKAIEKNVPILTREQALDKFYR